MTFVEAKNLRAMTLRKVVDFAKVKLNSEEKEKLSYETCEVF